MKTIMRRQEAPGVSLALEQVMGRGGGDADEKGGCWGWGVGVSLAGEWVATSAQATRSTPRPPPITASSIIILFIEK